MHQFVIFSRFAFLEFTQEEDANEAIEREVALHKKILMLSRRQNRSSNAKRNVCLRVDNLAFITEDEDLEQMFTRCSSTCIKRDVNTKKPLG